MEKKDNYVHIIERYTKNEDGTYTIRIEVDGKVLRTEIVTELPFKRMDV